MNTQHDALYNLKISGNLPSMPQVLVRLLDKCQAPDVDIQEVAQIVNKDAALSAKVLQLVNSAFIGPRKSINTIEQAVVYLGIDSIRNLVISVSVQQVFRRVQTNGLLNMDRFWHHSFSNALLAQKLALVHAKTDPSEAYLAGLLHDIGKLLLWMAFPGSYAPLLLKGIRCTNARLAFLEEEKLQINHCQAGAWLCEEWQLPPLIGDAIRYHHHSVAEVRQALPLTKIICFADLLSHNPPDAPECVEAAKHLFSLAPEDIGPLIAGIDEQVAELADHLGVRLPKLNKTSHDNDPETEEAHRETSLGLITRIRDISQLNGLLETLLKAEEQQHIVSAVEQGVQILFNEKKTLLLLPRGEKGTLVAQPSTENMLAANTRQLEFDALNSPDSLLALAMESGHVQHSFAARTSQEKPAHLFDAQLLNLMHSEGMIVFPLLCHEQFEGLLVIGLKAKAYDSLKNHLDGLQMLAGQAAMALQLENMRRVQTQRIVSERLAAATLVARKIGHEINNPLAIVRNYLHILERKLAKGDPINAEVGIIDDELERLTRITRGLEDLSTGNPPPSPVSLELTQALQKIIAPFQATLDAKGEVLLQFQAPDEPLEFMVDPGYLQQIVHNLIKNALESVDTCGTVKIHTELRDDQVYIHVEDTGPGISQEHKKELFHSGFSTKNSAHRGLGLSIALSLAKQMGGQLHCSSTPGQTLFTLCLPLKMP
ncbi:HDOD domain-containing protein [Desulfobulbus rhabdoformis]|uniref:HDOD domain-containing protein n=1 Tax=Desulfobulbus rhabdoformis TaxID=34032 RepID=UPI001964E122|nr:HDOD domain-containing protein [Desulfobulbus rhabdoformis]MBM9616047.1 HDOD domain-containing protein [Desulfobulbus rhabdoformis]